MAEKKPVTAGVFLECMDCGTKVSAEQIAITPEIKCPSCGYRVLRKLRPSIVKPVKAR